MKTTITIQPPLHQLLKAFDPKPNPNKDILINAAKQYTADILEINLNKTIPNSKNGLVITGHQANWHSCGVWLKTVLASTLAKFKTATAIQIIVDHDIYNTSLTVPVKIDTSLSKKIFKMDRSSPLLPVEFRKLNIDDSMHNTIKRHHDFSVLADLIDDNFFLNDNIKPADYITRYQALINQRLGLNVLYLPTSRLSELPAFLEYLDGTINRREEFAQMYNNAFEKIGLSGIKKLEIGKYTELPFWVIKDRQRDTLKIKTQASNVIYFKNNEYHIKGLNDCRFRFRPKAVALTLFLRQHASDMFIHGIGGAKYEKMVDELIVNFYNQKPKSYTVASMTKYLFETENEKIYSNPKNLDQQIRKIKFNPENYLPLNKSISQLVLVDKKNKLKEKLKTDQITLEDKRKIHHGISNINKHLLRSLDHKIERLYENKKLIETRKKQQEILYNRNYFFGFFSRYSLSETIKYVEDGIAKQNR